MAPSRALCEAVHRLRYEDLPPEVLASTKALIADCLGVLGGAARAPGVPQLLARVSGWERDGAASALLNRRRLSPPSAALVNAAAAHALDFDDLHDAARVHTSCIMVPAVLAASEARGGVSGREFLLAVATGAEVHARLGLACYNALGHGWHPTMVLGVLAGALACGKVLGLGADGLVDALGLAFHQASGSAQAMHDGVLAKRLGAGFAARSSVLAAFLAQDGLTGPTHALEGEAGLFQLYERGEVKPERLLEDWGRSWRVPEYSFKPYPGCRCNHTVITLGIALHREGIQPQDVAAAEIGLGHVNWKTVGQPYDAARRSVVHAQFNAAYGLARALFDGKVGLSAYTEDTVGDIAVAALAAVTRVVDDPAIEPLAIAPARVRLMLKNGAVRQVESPVMKGSPEDPIDREGLQDKLADCLAFGLGASREEAARLAGAVEALELAPDAAGSLVEAFPRGNAPTP